ncbi:MAG: GtrA family protein [Candidatus Phosphoribacter sp.]
MIAPSAPSLRHRRGVRQFVKFGLVGGSGVVVNMLVTIAMHKLNGGTVNGRAALFAIPATPYFARYLHLVWIVAFLVANLWNFQLNRRWTFRATGYASWWRQFWPFLLVGSVAAVAGLFIITALTHPESPIYLPEPWFNESAGLRSRVYWAQLLTIVLTMPINFVVNKLWTFRVGPLLGSP